MPTTHPSLVVLSTLFPSPVEPVAGIFIKERMFRVARHLPLTVVSPQPWFPLQALLRRWKPGYRPERPAFERMEGIEVHRPRFLSLPGIGRRLDGVAIALAVRPLLRRLQREGRADVLDVHFGYPDGHAGSLLARWCGLPWSLTVRGKEQIQRHDPVLRSRLIRALGSADAVVAVSAGLRDVALELGTAPTRIHVIGNGVDADKFSPMSCQEARRMLDIPDDATVLVSVGGISEGKGFHRVVECMPGLLERHPTLLFLIVGGPSPAGDYTPRVRATIEALGLVDRVRWLGAMRPEQLRVPLSAANLFVLATRSEGWANVLLEAMACGLPVITTRVGGNPEVLAHAGLGSLVPFGDEAALRDAIDTALCRPWDRAAIREHALANGWDRRVEQVLALVRGLHDVRQRSGQATRSGVV